MPFELGVHLRGLDVLNSARQAQKLEIRCPLALAELPQKESLQGVVRGLLTATSGDFIWHDTGGTAITGDAVKDDTGGTAITGDDIKDDTGG
jgi:hypothetical protein